MSLSVYTSRSSYHEIYKICRRKSSVVLRLCQRFSQARDLPPAMTVLAGESPQNYLVSAAVDSNWARISFSDQSSNKTSISSLVSFIWWRSRAWPDDSSLALVRVCTALCSAWIQIYHRIWFLCLTDGHLPKDSTYNVVCLYENLSNLFCRCIGKYGEIYSSVEMFSFMKIYSCMEFGFSNLFSCRIWFIVGKNSLKLESINFVVSTEDSAMKTLLIAGYDVGAATHTLSSDIQPLWFGDSDIFIDLTNVTHCVLVVIQRIRIRLIFNYFSSFMYVSVYVAVFFLSLLIGKLYALVAR